MGFNENKYLVDEYGLDVVVVARKPNPLPHVDGRSMLLGCWCDIRSSPTGMADHGHCQMSQMTASCVGAKSLCQTVKRPKDTGKREDSHTVCYFSGQNSFECVITRQ
eukprot:scaffold6899_cov183-Amphora_coffeaeformis.AAC.28